MVAPTFARRVFLSAAAYGFIVLLPQYFLEARIGRDFPPPITHPEQFYGFVGVALAWQVAFLIIASDVRRYRPLMIPAILEKLAFGVPVVVLFALGRIAPAVLFAGVIDLAFATAFVFAYRATAS